MRAKREAGRSKAAVVSLAVRIAWVLAVGCIVWVTLPKVAPEKVNMKNLRGAAKFQAREQLARQ